MSEEEELCRNEWAAHASAEAKPRAPGNVETVSLLLVGFNVTVVTPGGWIIFVIKIPQGDSYKFLV